MTLEGIGWGLFLVTLHFALGIFLALFFTAVVKDKFAVYDKHYKRPLIKWIAVGMCFFGIFSIFPLMILFLVL